MKKKMLIISIIVINILPLYAFKIYDKNDIKIKMSTEVNAEYNYEASLYPGLSSFEIPSAKITIDGEYMEKLEFSISTELAEMVLENAYIKYNLLPPLKIKMGQYKIKYGREETSDYRPQTSHSEASKNFTPGRSIGISFYGNELFNILNYNFAFSNDFNSDEDNETGQHTLTLQLEKEFDLNQEYVLTPGYNILYNTDEIFSHGIYIELLNNDSKNLYLLLEYLEQRYFNYYWNRSFYISTAYRFSFLEPFFNFEYYDDYVGEMTNDDALISEIGLNLFQMDDKLKISLSYTNDYYPENATNSLNHKMALQVEIKI